MKLSAPGSPIATLGDDSVQAHVQSSTNYQYSDLLDIESAEGSE